MKRFVLVILVIGFSLLANAQIIWNGGATGNWNDAANWLPTTVPTSADDVIFNTSVIVEMDILSSPTPYTINSLLITNNSSVELQKTQAAGGVRILQLASTSTITPGLKIDNASTLIIDAINTSGTLDYTLALTGNAGVTGEIYGNLYIKGTGVGNGGAEIDLSDGVSNFAALVVKSSGVIKYFDDTDNTSPSTGSFLTMENGSIYEIEKNGGSFPPGVWDLNSLARVTNLSGTSPPSFNGSSYGDLEWTCPNQNNFSLSKNISFNDVNLLNTNAAAFPTPKVFRIVNSGSTPLTLTINGNLNVTSNSILEITGSLTSPLGGGHLIVNGNINNQGAIITSGIAGTINKFELNGTTNQDILSTGAITAGAGGLNFIMNNSAGATLNTPLILPDELTLTDGKITTDLTNILTMVDGSSYSGGSTSSFVQGPMKKIGATDFTFPVGEGGIYAPITISGGTGGAATDAFIATYFRTDPRGVIGNVLEPPINHISYAEYWELTQDNGSASKIVTLDIHSTSFSKTVPDTYVSRFDGTKWIKIASTSSSTGPCANPIYDCGTTASSNALTEFGSFTLATDLDFISNPLPIKLINFSATKISAGLAVINWQLAECCSKDALFELEKSTDSRNFTLASSINGSETNKFYFYNDSRLGKGISYYRLKMTDTDGSVKYSKVIAIVNDEKGFVITSIAPNPVQHAASLTISAAKQSSVKFKVYDVAGNLVKQWQSTIAAGNNVLNMEVSALANGTYHVLASSLDTRTVFRFIKQ